MSIHRAPVGAPVARLQHNAMIKNHSHLESYFSGVDFWSDPLVNNSDVTFLLSPDQEKRVKQSLRRTNMKFNVTFHSLLI